MTSSNSLTPSLPLDDDVQPFELGASEHYLHGWTFSIPFSIEFSH